MLHFFSRNALAITTNIIDKVLGKQPGELVINLNKGQQIITNL